MFLPQSSSLRKACILYNFNPKLWQLRRAICCSVLNNHHRDISLICASYWIGRAKRDQWTILCILYNLVKTLPVCFTPLWVKKSIHNQVIIWYLNSSQGALANYIWRYKKSKHMNLYPLQHLLCRKSCKWVRYQGDDYLIHYSR